MPKSLGSRTSSGARAFEKYVVENPNWSIDTEYYVLPGREHIPLVKNPSASEPFLKVTQSDRIQILSKNLINIRRVAYCKVKIGNVIGYFPINSIKKPVVRKDSMSEERATISSLNRQIKALKIPLDLIVADPSNKYLVVNNVAGVVNIPGTPKADFALVDDRGKKLFYISHKAPGGPERFSQYSGVSEKSGNQIYKHPEVQEFMRLCSQFIEKDKLIYPLMVSIKDPKLKKYAIFGIDYGSKEFGVDNVNLLAQGNPILEVDKIGIVMLKFSEHMALSGNISMFTGQYEPVLGATFKSGRGFYYNGRKFTGARLGVFPRSYFKYRPGTIDLDKEVKKVA